MTSTRCVMGALFAMLLLAASCWFVRPHRRPEQALVEPRLTSLREPFQSCAVNYYMDGGSIGIDIVDAAGRKEQFAIACHLGSSERYERVFVGALHDALPGVANSTATKQALILVLAEHRNGDPYIDVALAELANRPLDWARCWVHRYQGHYNH